MVLRLSSLSDSMSIMESLEDEQLDEAACSEFGVLCGLLKENRIELQ